MIRNGDDDYVIDWGTELIKKGFLGVNGELDQDPMIGTTSS